ncbi:DUF2218 domain-containing protein [Aurantiacibacter zhengii]|uniref:DUF2218 domain-containing protein n=1 Tax=Aurantiacibacter zhengii TaxID=2307003 RepID=A0A418NUH7_9SPHN|nr:DUF2218 domain-containing protein [Aurantiacibacter zhengii]RIV87736.1 DUF2218 domain-containing protein [Aurantiacibacter zhengii]
MSSVAEARVATTKAAKYAAQLGKHWTHNLDVQEDGEARLVTFPHDARGANWKGDALVTLDPQGEELLIRIEASEDGQRDGLKDALERHIDRFAFREVPLSYNWRDVA